MKKSQPQSNSSPKKAKQSFIVKPRKPGKTGRKKLHMYGETVTKQSFKDDCDINLIMAKYVKTGVIDNVRDNPPEYGFASSDDFRQSMEIVSKANSMFENMPSKIRNKFENDPAKFLDFVQDEKNLPEMQEMGLTIKSNNEKPDLANLKPTNQEYQHGIDEHTTESPKGDEKRGKEAPPPSSSEGKK